jgi:hypothetical protein
MSEEAMSSVMEEEQSQLRFPRCLKRRGGHVEAVMDVQYL